MIKFTCINEQHADIAAKQLRESGRECAVLGRAVVSSGCHDNHSARVICEAMGYTETPTEYDLSCVSK